LSNCTKRTLVKYVETETGSYLPDEFGRCDRSKTVVITKHHRVKKEYLIKVLSLRDISDKACHLTDEFVLFRLFPNPNIGAVKAIVIFRNGFKIVLYLL
jgi:hypothetical protein